ncbi:adenylyltransferase/cytidyltransferase family protein [Rothia nasimurium]|uniref:adenylyltransferase/cytidyltransferase family protein n=1 Tax=Rothia nasimurium TaxID=85336 RepID=UPI001623324F|nr:adenylyltransferase/cytidyltransferase family protein [Rothia nasimurium]
MNIGYAAGAFDLFHVGHLNILREAKKNCDYLIAGVVSDEMLELTKGRRPIVPLAERMEIVSHIDFVDEVRAETVEDKLETWEQVRFNTFFKGDDWKGTARGKELERRFAEVGVQVVYFPYTAHTSSTKLRAALKALSMPSTA